MNSTICDIMLAGDGERMELKLKKQPQKYLEAADARTRRKLEAALEELSRLEGDIVPLSGVPNMYRYKTSIIVFCFSGCMERSSSR